MAVEILLFDCGGVLFHFDPARRLAALAAATGLAPAEVQARIWDSGFDHDCDRGRYDLVGAGRELARLLGQPLELDQAARLMASAFSPWGEVLDLALRPGPPRRGLLTNNGPLVEDGLRQAFPEIIDRFEAAPFFSHRLGATKPDPAIYRAVEERLGLAPQTIGFIDDSPANVAAAESRGWQAMRFEGEADLWRIEGLLS